MTSERQFVKDFSRVQGILPPSSTLLCCVVAVLAVAVYVNSLFNGFALDDVYIVQWNRRVHEIGDLREIWLTPYWPASGRELGLYRPAAIFLYALQWAVGGGEPWLFHAVNVLLHAIATVFVFALLRTLTATTSAAIGAALFAVHPVHTEAVANVVGQAELVAAIAVLAACLIHVNRPTQTVSWPRRICILLLFLVALLTKESAVVLPALLVLCDVARGHLSAGRTAIVNYMRALAMPMFLICAAFGAYMIVRFDVMSGSLIGVDANPALPYLKDDVRVLNALRAFPEFMRLLFFPHELAADYLPAVIMPVDSVRPMVVLGGILLAAVTGLAVATFWRPRLGFPAAWFLISICTVSNLFFPIGVLVAERTLYLPSLALSAGAAFAWAAIPQGVSRRNLFLARSTLMLVVALFAIRTWTRNPDWKDNTAVYEAIVRDHPHAYRSQWVQAAALRLQGQKDLAREHYEMAYRIYSRDPQMTAEYGAFLLELGEPDEAARLLLASYEMHPHVVSTSISLARAYLVANRPDDALRYVWIAESLGASTSTMVIRALATYQLGDVNQAVGAARIVLRNPDAPWQTVVHLARILAVGGFEPEAIDAIARARTAAQHAAGRTVLDEVEAAIRSDCYRTARDHPQAQLPCDPLSRVSADHAAQNATTLQNARDPEGQTRLRD